MNTRIAFTTLALIGTVTAAAARAQTRDIVETAVASGSFTTLARALTAADLVGTLKGPGPFTVFAPTDEAFAKLPAGTLDDLLKPENRATLRRVLTYHVVPGRVMAADVVTIDSAKAVSGDTLSIKASGGTVTVDKARVVKTDIAASNGVIHVVDRVLLPPGK
ncbi:MAG TPA: fasciclin domain-containing protein [Vicinamibacterales bacterium]|nr:fasciclin domain-containing protein [Vicinamibacterales bacterium]